jgi:hypothetical protein
MDPSAMGGDFIKRIQTAPRGILDIAAKYDNVTKVMNVSVKTTLESDISGDFRIACAIVEDDVRGTTSGFNQSNAYAGGASGVMGGFEKLPNPVPASQMVYDHVGRAIAPTFAGLPNAFGSSASKGASFVHNFTFPMDGSWNMNKMHIVGMFIDNTTLVDNGGTILVNDALKKAYAQGTEVAAISLLNGPDAMVSVYPNPSTNQFQLVLNVAANQAMQYEVSDVMGKVVYTSTMNAGKSTIDASAWSNGIYTLKLVDGTAVYQTRIIKN